jgi:hypothetical protein
MYPQPSLLHCSNEIKPNNVRSPCPAPPEFSILGKNWSVMYCNYEKQNQINNKLLDRVYPLCNMTVRPEYRSQYKVCSNYRNMNDTYYTYIKSRECKDELNPGKPDPIKFHQNIDTESKLKNLNMDANICNKPIIQYKPYYVNPLLLMTPGYDSIKYFS